MEIGQLVIKTSGRDSGNFALVVERIDNTYVLIDGNVRRKKCNVQHLEAIDKILKIKKNASTEEVKEALEKEGIKTFTKGSKRTIKEKPKKLKKSSEKKEVKKKNERIKD